MGSAPLPRQLKLGRAMNKDHGRIRRLEVNRPPTPGTLTFEVAQYAASPPGTTPATSFTLDHTLFGTSGPDGIGLTFDSGNIYVPDGWCYWATWGFNVQFNTIVADDALEWCVKSDDWGEHRRDALIGMDGQNAEFLGGGTFDYQTAFTAGPADMALTVMQTNNGSTFYPTVFRFQVFGIFGLPTPAGY